MAEKSKLVLWILVVSTMVMILNETVLSVALPIISRDFRVDATVVQWLTTGFLLVMAVVIPMTGFLLQRFSTRTMFVAALVLFALGTAAAGAAPSFMVLLVARMVQAVGTAIIIPLLMTVAMTTVPPERRGATMGLIGVVISVAPALGPTVSGVILSRWSWHWLFWAVLPIVVLCLVVGIRFIGNVSERSAAPLDVISVPLSALGFGGLVWGLSQVGTVFSDKDPLPLVALGLGLCFVALFVWRQLVLGRRDAALLDLRALGFGSFRVAVIAIAFGMGVLLGTAVVLPFFLQNSLGASALATGLLVLPGGLLQGLASPIVGRLYDQHGVRRLVIPGAIGLVAAEVGLSVVARMQLAGALFVVLALHIVLCLSLSLLMTPLMTDGLAALPQRMYSHGSAILNTLQQLGGAAGTAVLVAVMTVVTSRVITERELASAPVAGVSDTAQGVSAAFAVGAVLGCVALVAVLFSANKPKADKE